MKTSQNDPRIAPFVTLVAGTFTGTEVFTVTGTLSFSGFYPPSLVYTSTVATLGGNGTNLGLSIVPVQCNPETHQTRIWTRLVFDLQVPVDLEAASVDADGDGLPDYWENAYDLSAEDAAGGQGAAGGPDADGLTNAQEYGLGTSPVNPDTDQDGLTDGDEVFQGSDPLDPGSTARKLYLPMLLRR